MSIESEYAVIGALLVEPSMINEVDLVPDDFSIERYRVIYQAMLDTIASNKISDMFTLSTVLSKSYPEENWLVICGQAMKDCVYVKNLPVYAGFVKNESRIRSIKTICSEALNDIDSVEDGDGILDSMVQRLMALTITKKNHEHSISQALKKAIDMIDLANETTGIVGIPTGIDSLDSTLGGFHDSDLYVIGARPAVGKTSVLLNFANNHTEQCGIISTEQPAEQIASRLISINGRVNSSRIRNGTLEDYDWTKITNSVHHLHENNNIWINDKSGINITELIRQARKWKHQHNIKALYIDYIQRIKWTDQKIARWEQVGNVVLSLKELARDLNIPVIALAQVNRDVEKRNDKRPNMGDLANSSEIEKEADVIMTLYRDDVHNEDSDQKGIMEINVCKNRHGPTGNVRVVWVEESMRIENMVGQYAKEYH